MTKRRATLLDLDGTLVDSVPGIHEALRLTLATHADAGCSIEETRHWVGNGPRVLVTRGLQARLAQTPETARIDAALRTFSDHYLQTVYQGALYADVSAGLRAFRAAGLQLACITNKPSAFTLPYLEHLDIAGHFNTVICADQVRQPKPHPESLVLACERLGVKASQAVMVGDSINDLLPAQALAMPRIAVTYGYHQGEDLGSAAPVLMADRFQQVTDFLLFDR